MGTASLSFSKHSYHVTHAQNVNLPVFHVDFSQLAIIQFSDNFP